MFVIDRSLYLSPEVVGEPGLRPLKEVDPFSLEALVAWLETKDPSETYDWRACNGTCLIAQYIYSRGMDGFLDYCSWSSKFWDQTGFPAFQIAGYAPHTFGAAKDRARKLLAEREK